MMMMMMKIITILYKKPFWKFYLLEIYSPRLVVAIARNIARKDWPFPNDLHKSLERSNGWHHTELEHQSSSLVRFWQDERNSHSGLQGPHVGGVGGGRVHMRGGGGGGHWDIMYTCMTYFPNYVTNCFLLEPLPTPHKFLEVSLNSLSWAVYHAVLIWSVDRYTKQMLTYWIHWLGACSGFVVKSLSCFIDHKIQTIINAKAATSDIIPK